MSTDQASEHEIERDLLGEFLVELDEEFGPVAEGSIEQLADAWPV
ncbi:MAG: hypothetical protein AAGA99_19810 [Actinomycetota bacterium]